MRSLDIDTAPIHSAVGTVTDTVATTVAEALDRFESVVPAASRRLRRRTVVRRNRRIAVALLALVAAAAAVAWFRRRTAEAPVEQEAYLVPPVAGRPAA